MLPDGVRSRLVPGVNGLAMHILEAGFDRGDRPCLLLLHGFPEIAYSWRNQILPLARAGFRVIVPDQRGYGRTIGGDADYDGDVGASRMLNLVKDMLALLGVLGQRFVSAVIGHDFGSPVAAWCTLIRPDVFRSVVLMSAPFAGPPSLSARENRDDIHAALAALSRPRKHYHWYYSTREANADMWQSPQGVHAFLRAYFHYKSADWPGNRPFRLKSWTADELAKMPTYYIMDLDAGMAETVAPYLPSASDIAACRWLTEPELRVYSEEYRRNGFQGGLQWYRCMTDARYSGELALFSGRTIDVPSMFIAGKQDWGAYQLPGALERMRDSVCTAMEACHLLDGAGHWVQQEQSERVTALLLQFLERHGERGLT
jgi:pimeloyl-ACP methyl ester carboxylesterase